MIWNGSFITIIIQYRNSRKKRVSLKKKIFLFISLLLLTGCTREGDGSNIDYENNNQQNELTAEESNPISSVLEITGTDQYGRGAESDGRDTNSDEEPMNILTEDTDEIIIYFSRSGNTENLVKMIRNHNGADILELTLYEPYPADYDETVERAHQEMNDENYPEINTEIPDFSQYNRVYLGYQTWSSSLSNPIVSFLQDYGNLLEGKTIYPFSSNAGYGEGSSLEQIQELLPNNLIEESFSVEDKDVVSSQDELIHWLENQQ